MKWKVLITVAFGTFMATLDSSIVNIALPTIRQKLNAGDNVEWIVLSYLLVTTSTLLIMGRLSDMFGRKGIYILGFVIFVIGSFLCGLSWSIWSLVAFRVFQGLGASMIFALGPAIITDTFEPKQRGQALGWIGTVVAAGGSMGPVIGGVLLQHFGWSSIFYVNVPIGIIAIWRAWVVLPSRPRMPVPPFDIFGAVLLLIGVTFLLTGVDFGAASGHSWTDTIVIVLIASGLALILAFLYWEKRHEAPMLNLHLFSMKPFGASLSAAGLGFVAGGANIFILPFYLQLILHFSPQHAGFVMLAGPLTLSVASPLGGYLSDKISARWIASAGLLVTATGYFALSFLQADWSWHNVVWRTALLSLGFGLFQSPNSSSALNAVPTGDRGVGSSLLAFMRNLGMVFGIATGAAVWYSVRNGYASQHHVAALAAASQVAGMQVAYRVVGCLVVIAALISVTRGASPVAKPAEATQYADVAG